MPHLDRWITYKSWPWYHDDVPWQTVKPAGGNWEKYDTPIMIPNIPDCDHLKLEALKNYRMYRGKTMVSGFDFPPSPFLTTFRRAWFKSSKMVQKPQCFRVFPRILSSALGAHQARGWDPGGRGHQPGSMETPEDRQRSGPSGSGVGDGCCQWMVNGEWMC